MKKNILNLLRGDNQFQISLKNVSIADSYNTFPIHIASMCLLWTIVMIQNKWNFIGLVCLIFIMIDLCIIAYRSGYADMRRNLQRQINLDKNKR